eukprot:comp23790_c0_seq1/m.41299 comp23790_c0_seq1/g.41299  ORF comp23790_c0_seq1/g.41299 comp23790_c0_seq1/m.41299 type:complete len:204 (-) comp23790_c0_seq1:556-1167(-)
MVELKRRNRPGTKSEDLYNWPPQSLGDMESTLAVQQYIQQQIRANPHDLAAILAMPDDQDSAVWQYEHLRQITQDLNGLAVLMLEHCTCTVMKATDDFTFLCSAHKQPLDCNGVDYVLHLLDNTAALFNNPKQFPSRVAIPAASVKHFSAVTRRLYRIFAHAYFHHREIYDNFESETSLCARFTKFVRDYQLMPDKLLMIPDH